MSTLTPCAASLTAFAAFAGLLRATPAAERWLVFGLEDGRAAIWEYRPEPGELVRRAVLGESPWAPDLLFWRDAGPTELIRWQRRIEGERGHVVELHRLDRETGELQFLLRKRRLHALGATQGPGASVYLQSEDGIELLDPEEGQLRPLPRPFVLLQHQRERWLVQLREEADSRCARLFAPATGELSAAFPLPGETPLTPRDFEPAWFGSSPDGKVLAFVDAVSIQAAPVFGEPPRVVRTTLHLVDLAGTKRSVPLHVLVAGGSGIPVIYLSLDAAFDAQGRLHVAGVDPKASEGRAADSVVKTWSTWSPPDWERSDRAAPPEPLAPSGRSPALGYVPPYLAEALAEAAGELDLLAEFLQRKGHETPFRQKLARGYGYSHVPMAFSPDGRRILVRLRLERPQAELLFVDLEHDRLVPVRAPDLHTIQVRCVGD